MLFKLSEWLSSHDKVNGIWSLSNWFSITSSSRSPARLALPVRHRLRLRRLPGGLAWRAGNAEGKDSLRSLWGALGNKDKLAYPYHQALPTSPDDTSSVPCFAGLRKRSKFDFSQSLCANKYLIH